MPGEPDGRLEFPAEKLRVYAKAVELQDRVELRLPRMYRTKPDLARQVDRAVSSIVLNIAEGATEYSPAEKRRFYRMALRSAGEAAAGLRFFDARWRNLRVELELLAVTMAMLTGLARPLRGPDGGTG